MRYPVLLLVFALPTFFSAGKSAAQTVISLKNPGFEADKRAPGTNITGWINLGATFETPPDIQPGWFGVKLPAQEGENYLGMVVRETGTYEGVGQILESPLKKGEVYVFSLWLARADSYKSPVKGSTESVIFDAPVVLEIWGANTKTKKTELLAESSPIENTNWVCCTLSLNPILSDYNQINLMAYYAFGHENKNGNILIDNCSDIWSDK